MKLLSLDIASNCGWCVYHNGEFRSGVEVIKTPKVSVPKAVENLEYIIKRHNPTHVVVESVSVFGRNSQRTARLLHGLNVAAEVITHKFGAEWLEPVPPMSIKKTAANILGLPKAVKKEGVLEAGQLFVPGACSFDEGDAIVLAVHTLKGMGMEVKKK